MHQFWIRLHRGTLEGLDFDEVTAQLGLDLIDANTGNLTQDLPTVTQFLNRILSLDIDRQNQVFDAFFGLVEQNVANAIAAGTLDVGVETVKALKTDVASEQTVFTDPETGAETRYVHLQLTHPRAITSWDAIEQARIAQGPNFVGYYLNERSGRVSSVTTGANRTTSAGDVIPTFISRSPTSLLVFEQSEVDQLTQLSMDDAQRLWTEAANSASPTYTEDMHIVTGTLLPIWDRLPGKTRVVRLQSDDGRRFLGRLIPPKDLQQTLTNLGATTSAPRITPEEAVRKILDERYTIRLANGWVIRQSRVSGEPRMEILNPEPAGISYADAQALQQEGAFTERIQWQTRIFLPTGPDAANVLAVVTQYRPIVSVEPPVRSGAEVLEQQRQVQAQPVTPATPVREAPAAPEATVPEASIAEMEARPVAGYQTGGSRGRHLVIEPEPTPNPDLPDPTPRNDSLSGLAGDERGSVAITEGIGRIMDAFTHALNVTRPKLWTLEDQAPDVYEAAIRHAVAFDNAEVVARGHLLAMTRLIPGRRAVKQRYLHNFARYWNSEMGKGIRNDPERAPQVRVQILDAAEEDALLDDPIFQKLLTYYRTRVQPEMEALAPSAGIHTFLETPSGFYGKLHALKVEDDPTDLTSTRTRLDEKMPGRVVGYTSTGQIPRQLSRQRAKAALQAKGSGVYSEDLEDMLEHMYADRFTAAYKNRLIETVLRYRVPVNPRTRKAPATTEFAGNPETPVVLSDVGTAKARAMARKLPIMPLEDVWLPKPVEEAWREVTVGSTWDEKRVPILSQIGHGLTTAMLFSPADSFVHAMNVFMALTNAPGVGQSLGTFGRGMAWTPARFFSVMADIFNIPGSEMDRILPILSEYGGLRTSMYGHIGAMEKGMQRLGQAVGGQLGRVVGAPARGEAIGGEVGRVAGRAGSVFKRATFDYPSYGRGLMGAEARARVALYKAMEAKYPDMAPAERVRRMNNFIGTYVPALQPEIIRFLRLFGLGNPFAVATFTMMKTGVKGLAGRGPAGFSPEVAWYNWAAIPIALYLLHSLFDPEGDKRDPWEQPNWDPLQLRIYRTASETLNVPVRFLFNSYARAIRATGIGAIGKAVASGEKEPGELLRAWLLNGLNVGISLASGPFGHFIFGLGGGVAPYLTPQGELLPLEPSTMRPSLGGRLWTGVKAAIPMAKDLGEGLVEPMLDPLETPTQAAVKDQTLEWLKTFGQVSSVFGFRLKPGVSEREMASYPGRARMGRIAEIANDIAKEVRRAPIEGRRELVERLLRQRIRPEDYPYAMRAIRRSLRQQTRSIARHQPRLPLPPTGTESPTGPLPPRPLR
jgi:hypothetical protein